MGTGRRGRRGTIAAGVGFVLLAAVAGWSAWADRLREVPPGATVTDAEIISMTSEEQRQRFGPHRIEWRTRYRFTDANGTVRQGADLVAVGRHDVRRGHPAPVWYTDDRSGLLVGVDADNRPWGVRTLTFGAAAAAVGVLLLGLVGWRWVQTPVTEA